MGPDCTGPLATMNHSVAAAWMIYVCNALDNDHIYSEVARQIHRSGLRLRPSQIRAMHCACLRLVDRQPWSVAAESAGYPSTMAGMMAVRRLFAVRGKARLPEWAT